ncbi:unnamed protein product, partial [Cladocopium goreaui]
AILSTLPETRQKAVRGRENKDVAADAVLSGYEMRNQAPAEQDGSGRIAKIFICTVLGASAAWFCRQNWGHVESAMADIQAGVRYSAVPCDGENLLTVEPEESARPAPLRGGDQEQVSWLHLCIARLQGMVQRWSPSRYPIDEGSEKDDPRTPEEKQGLLDGDAGAVQKAAAAETLAAPCEGLGKTKRRVSQTCQLFKLRRCFTVMRTLWQQS